MPVLAACHMVKYDEEADRRQVVAVIDGEEIIKDSIIDDYETYKQYAYIDEDSENTETGRKIAHKMKVGFLDDIIEKKVLEKKFEEYDIPELTEEEKAEVQQAVDEFVATLDTVIETEMETVRTSYPDLSDEELREKAKFNVLQKYGISDGSYYEDLTRDKRKEKLIDRCYEGEILSDEEIKKWYDENLRTQKKDMDDSISNYGSYAASSIALYCPTDRYYARVIYVNYYDEIMKEVKELRAEGKREEADSMMEEARAKAEEEAKGIYEKAVSGEDFMSLINEYSDDMYSKQEPFITEGFETYNGMRARNTAWIKAVLGLKEPGDISEPAYYKDNGYYIFQLVSITPAGEIPLEKVHDSIYDMLYNTAKDEAYQELLKQWKKEYHVVYYEDRL